MKILIVHNNYGKYSGEEAVVDKMIALFGELGHEVVTLRMTTEGSRESVSGKIRGFLQGIYSPSGVRAMRDTIRRHNPDVINIHNLYPFISPASLFEAKKAGIPVVMTIHNFRLMCPTGLFMRDDTPCELCLDRGNEWGCIQHNCEHSRFKSLGYALRNCTARLSGAYRKCVDRFACITDFQRQKLSQAGFDSDKLLLIPNSVALPAEAPSFESAGDYIGFCGRISREKGVDMIVEVARRHPDIPFRIAGAVREEDPILQNLPPNVKLCGYLSGNDLEDFYRNARFMVMASRCYEGFPMAILEAARFGKPTIGPRHGGFTEIIGGDGSPQDAVGILFSPSDTDDLDRAVSSLWNDTEETIRLGKAAFSRLSERYSTQAVARQWDALLEETRKRL